MLAADLGAAGSLLSAVHAMPGGDKIAHFLLVGILSLLVNLTLRSASFRVGPVRLQYGTIALLTLSIIEESSQRWLASRQFSLGDMAANCAGIVVFGYVAAWWVARGERESLETAHGEGLDE